MSVIIILPFLEFCMSRKSTITKDKKPGVWGLTITFEGTFWGVEYFLKFDCCGIRNYIHLPKLTRISYKMGGFYCM